MNAMREMWARSASTPAPVRKIRRSLKFSCGRSGLRSAISRLARSYGLVDEYGSPHDSEVVRLLLVTALTAGSADRVATAVNYAIAVQRPMLVAACGRRITRRYATGPGLATTRRHGRATCERKNQARVTLDDWLYEALTALAPHWQDELGRVRDGRMMAELCASALSDPDLATLVGWFVQRTSRLRERLAQAEGWIAEVFEAAMREDDGLQRRTA